MEFMIQNFLKNYKIIIELTCYNRFNCYHILRHIFVKKIFIEQFQLSLYTNEVKLIYHLACIYFFLYHLVRPLKNFLYIRKVSQICFLCTMFLVHIQLSAKFIKSFVINVCSNDIYLSCIHFCKPKSGTCILKF